MLEKLIRKISGLSADAPLPGGVRVLKEIVEWILVIVVAVVVAFGIRKYFFTVVRVDGNSMKNTLHHNDRMFVRIFNYTPKNGDIVVIYPFGDKKAPYIKRVVATEGQSIYVDVAENSLYVDGEKVKENYDFGSAANHGINFPVDKNGVPVDVNGMRNSNYADDMLKIAGYVTPTRDNPYVIPDNCVFVMGDNRGGSTDSRVIGPVRVEDVLGKAEFRFFPFDGFGFVK